MYFKSYLLRDISVPTFEINGQTITGVQQQKYLGVTIHDDLRDDADIKREIKSVYARGNSLIRRFKACDSDKKLSSFRHFAVIFMVPLYGLLLISPF